METPRQKATRLGDAWNPPRKGDNSSMQNPGCAWTEASTKKLNLLGVICTLLSKEGILPKPMSFGAAMEFIGADNLRPPVDFRGRVFIYLVMVVLAQKSSSDDAIAAVLAFLGQGLVSPDDFAAATVQSLKKILDDYDINGKAAATLKSIGTDLVANFEGSVPFKRADLSSICDDTVTSLLMSHVFGSTDTVVGLHTRKILTALDMVDWEESGTSEKAEIKMVDLPPALVKRSLKTWLPKGEGSALHDKMDSLGRILGNLRQGTWGKVTRVLNSNLSPKEKKAATEMVLSISQFYKATRPGGRSTRSCRTT
ncbi:unknown protein [Seminavis robusta]|uniref:Uncharacterized protein n=1 Tax=Seminavis robusta TaxID=568900 RepID=A0A9N8HCD1_9STRA|nr:unknown protein [Seminavis robusta]|eukprot:Sro214_g088840.1 n/a (311) ;mRNA; f:75604-76620